MAQQQPEVGRKPLVEDGLFERTAPTPSHADIVGLAFAFWEQRGGGDGLAEQDWFEAERQLLEPRAKAQPA
jgi:hypothetical protein